VARHRPDVGKHLLPLVDAAEDVDLLCDERGGVTPARPRRPAHAAGDRPAQGVQVQHAHVVELALAGRAAEDVHAIVHCGGGVPVAAGRQLSGSLQCAPGDPVRVELVHVVQEGIACSLASEEVEVRAALGQGVPLARRRRGAEHAGLRPSEGVRRHREDMQVAERLRLGIAPAEEEDALLHQGHRVVAARGGRRASGAWDAPREGVRVEDVQVLPRLEGRVCAAEDV